MTFYQAFGAPTAHRAISLPAGVHHDRETPGSAAASCRSEEVPAGGAPWHGDPAPPRGGQQPQAPAHTWGTGGTCEKGGEPGLSLLEKRLSLERKRAGAPGGADLECGPLAEPLAEPLAAAVRGRKRGLRPPARSTHRQRPHAAPKSPVHAQEPGLRGEMSRSRAETGKSKMSLEYPVTRERKGLSKERWGHVRRHRAGSTGSPEPNRRQSEHQNQLTI